MKITDVRIRQLFENRGRLKAIVSVALDDAIAVHNIKIIQGDDRLFLAMPTRQDVNGAFIDIVHPIDNSVRDELEGKVLNCYLAALMDFEYESKRQEKSA